MLPKESRELRAAWVIKLIRHTLNSTGTLRAAPLPTNNYERHKNWKIAAGRTSYLLRVENPFTNKVRRTYLRMHLDDEITILKLLQSPPDAPAGRDRGSDYEQSPPDVPR